MIWNEWRELRVSKLPKTLIEITGQVITYSVILNDTRELKKHRMIYIH